MRVKGADYSDWCENCDNIAPKKGEGKIIEVWGTVISGRESSSIAVRAAFNQSVVVRFTLCNECFNKLAEERK